MKEIKTTFNLKKSIKTSVLNINKINMYIYDQFYL